MGYPIRKTQGAKFTHRRFDRMDSKEVRVERRSIFAQEVCSPGGSLSGEMNQISLRKNE
jgi:hypothetical protein